MPRSRVARALSYVPLCAHVLRRRRQVARRKRRDALVASTLGTIGGGHNIGVLSSFALICNNITGPGLVSIPPLIAQSGIVTPLATFAVVMCVSSLAGTMLAEAMRHLPKNSLLRERVEFLNVAQFYFGRRSPAYWITVVLFVLSLTALNVAQIVISAQVVDYALVAIDRTCGLQFGPASVRFTCPTSLPAGDVTPFTGAFAAVSLGYFVVMLAALPLSYMNLDDNKHVQNASFCVLVLITIMWCALSLWVYGFDAAHGEQAHASLVPFGSNQAQVLGVVMFNYVFVTSLPSWVSEKRPHVSVNRIVWGSALFSTLQYLLLGLLAGGAFAFPEGDDLLSVIDSSTAVRAAGVFGTAARITVFLFPPVALVTSIPVFSVIARYNLLSSGLIKRSWIANLVAIGLPWIMALAFYAGSGLVTVVNFSSVLFQGVINYIVPIIFYLLSLQHNANRARRADYEQWQLQQEAAATAGDKKAPSGAGDGGVSAPDEARALPGGTTGGARADTFASPQRTGGVSVSEPRDIRGGGVQQPALLQLATPPLSSAIDTASAPATAATTAAATTVTTTTAMGTSTAAASTSAAADDDAPTTPSTPVIAYVAPFGTASRSALAPLSDLTHDASAATTTSDEEYGELARSDVYYSTSDDSLSSDDESSDAHDTSHGGGGGAGGVRRRRARRARDGGNFGGDARDAYGDDDAEHHDDISDDDDDVDDEDSRDADGGAVGANREQWRRERRRRRLKLLQQRRLKRNGGVGARVHVALPPSCMRACVGGGAVRQRRAAQALAWLLLSVIIVLNGIAAATSILQCAALGECG